MKSPLDHSRPIDLICMGRVAVDFYAEQINSPLPDAQTFRCYLGGCAGNIAVGSARLGLKSAMFSYIGTDDMGQLVLKILKKEGVDTTLLKQTPEHLTALVILGVNPPNQFPLIFYRENCADMQIQPEDCDEEFFTRAKALLMTGTGLSTESMRKASHRAIELANQCKTAVIIDLDYRPVLWGLTSKGLGEKRYQPSKSVTKHYQQVLPKCQLIVGTEEEVLIAGGVDDLNQALKNIHKLTNAPIVLKKGSEGCEIFLEQKSIRGKAYPVKVFNVLGAGDAFMSGFLRGWLRGESWEMCATYSNVSGAIVVSRHGCAPAIPNFEELQYFIQNYDQDQNLLSSRKIKLLHRRSTVGNPSKEPLLILAYDHRWQFEKSVQEAGKNTELISEFKQHIFNGFCRARENLNDNRLAILIDPQYGKAVLKKATDKNITLGVPIEAAGIMPLKWSSDKLLYETILQRPKPWFVKVLWQYHPAMPPDLKQMQLNQLIELNRVCDDLERKLMVELILPDEFNPNGESVAQSITDVYRHDIYPYWWKIAALNTEHEWQRVSEAVKTHDEDARIIILGGSKKEVGAYEQQFKRAKSIGIVTGFAIGRSIFWQAWLDLIHDKITIEMVDDIIAKKYTELINIWENA